MSTENHIWTWTNESTVVGTPCSQIYRYVVDENGNESGPDKLFNDPGRYGWLVRGLSVRDGDDSMMLSGQGSLHLLPISEGQLGKVSFQRDQEFVYGPAFTKSNLSPRGVSHSKAKGCFWVLHAEGYPGGAIVMGDVLNSPAQISNPFIYDLQASGHPNTFLGLGLDGQGVLCWSRGAGVFWRSSEDVRIYGQKWSNDFDGAGGASSSLFKVLYQSSEKYASAKGVFLVPAVDQKSSQCAIYAFTVKVNQATLVSTWEKQEKITLPKPPHFAIQACIAEHNQGRTLYWVDLNALWKGEIDAASNVVNEKLVAPLNTTHESPSLAIRRVKKLHE